MKKRVGKGITTAVIAAVVIASGSLFFVKGALAATGSIYVTPASASVLNGNNVTLNLYINPGTTVTGVQAVVSFDTSKLQYVSADTSSSAFPIQLSQTVSGGSITIYRGNSSGGVSTASVVESITFKALVGSGSASVSLGDSSATNATDTGGNYTNPALAGATITFTSPVTPPATCPTGQTGTPPNCVTPTTPTSPSTGGSGSGSSSSTKSSGSSSSTAGGATTNTSTAQPASTPAGSTPATLTAKKIAYTTAVLTANSKDPTQVYIRYGIGDKLDLQTPVSDFATSHTIALDPSLLVPGLTYSYVIVATNQQGIVSQTAPATFTTTGLKISVGVFDKNDKPIAGKSVTLHSTTQTVKTDGKGIAVFNNVTPGSHHVVYTAGKTSYTQPITVVNDVETSGDTQAAPLQNFSVVYAFTQTAMNKLWIAVCVLILIIGILVVLGQTGRLGFAMFLRPQDHGAPLVTPAIVVGGNSGPTSTTDTNEYSSPAPVAVQDHLNAIPDPTRPVPGTTVAPKTPGDATDNTNGQGS